MTTVADMVDELIAAGTPPALAASIVTQAFAAGAMSVRPQTSAEIRGQSRLEKDRIRKQNVRDNLRKSTEIHGNPQMSADVPLSKRESLEEREAVSADGTWMPPDDDWRDAVSKLGLQIADSEMAKFREINRRTGAKRDSDWRVWVQRAVDYQAKTKPQPQAAVPVPEINWEATVKLYAKTGHWSSQAGPDPESPACRCPPEILEKHAVIAMRSTG